MRICPASVTSATVLTLLSSTPHPLASPGAAAAVGAAAVAASQPSDEPSYFDTGDFASSVLISTNFFRYEHIASSPAWNNSLQTYAQDWVDGCNFAHSGGRSGENLAEGYPTASAAVDAWGDERTWYDFAAPGFSEATGHCMQLVWKDSQTVRCGRKFCDGSGGTDGWLLACEYWPVGNVLLDSFGADVQSQVNGECGYVFHNGSLGANGAGSTSQGNGQGGSGSGGDDGDGDGDGQSEAARALSGSPVLALVVALALASWLG